MAKARVKNELHKWPSHQIPATIRGSTFSSPSYLIAPSLCVWLQHDSACVHVTATGGWRADSDRPIETEERRGVQRAGRVRGRGQRLVAEDKETDERKEGVTGWHRREW